MLSVNIELDVGYVNDTFSSPVLSAVDQHRHDAVEALQLDAVRLKKHIRWAYPLVIVEWVFPKIGLSDYPQISSILILIFTL